MNNKPAKIPKGPTGPEDATERPVSAVEIQSGKVAVVQRIARFRGRPMLMVTEPFEHFVPLHRERFDQIAYPILGGLSRSKMGDVFAYVANTAEDLTGNDALVSFGVTVTDEFEDVTRPVVWDMRKLEVTDDDASKTIWRSPYRPVETSEPIPFVLELAQGSSEVYDDIMQSMAALIMSKKPDGVIWWVGDGANGKSTLMDAIYKIFPGQLSSITVGRLTDGRDTPSLNGTLGNVVKESSEKRIEDTEIYKSIGTHEDFRVHKFHSQDDIMIHGNVHHIFSGNSIPAFNDKGFSARRRTFIVPFNARFKSDPTFEQRVFTDELFGQLIYEMMRYAKQLQLQGYRYKWSAITLAAKEDYDSEANSAEDYGRSLIAQGVVAFDSFHPIKQDYENWCADNGYVPLGVGNLRRAMTGLGFERLSVRTGEDTSKRYKLPNITDGDLQSYSSKRPGLYTTTGFRPSDPLAHVDVPNFSEAVKPDDEPPIDLKRKKILREW